MPFHSKLSKIYDLSQITEIDNSNLKLTSKEVLKLQNLKSRGRGVEQVEALIEFQLAITTTLLIMRGHLNAKLVKLLGQTITRWRNRLPCS